MALAQAQPPQEVQLRAADGLPVYATFYAASPSRPIVLLFHHADSNRGEYADIAPELVRWGFNALAIDQRSGGGMWNRPNQTARALGRWADFIEAMPDLEAALQWAKTRRYHRIVVWGSSYSAALVFLLAAQHPEVSAVVAFSPGEYLNDPRVVRQAASRVRVPVFITSAHFEAGRVRAIWQAVGSRDKIQFVPKEGGMHGSRVLATSYGGEYWVALRPFLIKMRAIL